MTEITALGATVKELEWDSIPKEQRPLDILPKTLFSMMLPEIAKSLHEQQIRSVLIVGIEAHVCVLQTCLDLLDQNFDVHIIAESVVAVPACRLGSLFLTRQRRV